MSREANGEASGEVDRNKGVPMDAKACFVDWSISERRSAILIPFNIRSASSGSRCVDHDAIQHLP